MRQGERGQRGDHGQDGHDGQDGAQGERGVKGETARVTGVFLLLMAIITFGWWTNERHSCERASANRAVLREIVMREPQLMKVRVPPTLNCDRVFPEH